MTGRKLLRSGVLAGALMMLGTGGLAAQVEDASEWLERCRESRDWSSRGPRERHCEVRELTLAAGQPLSVDGRENGGITVRAWDRNEVLVQALVSATGETAGEARSAAEAVRISTEGRRVRAEGSSRSDDGWWSVSYRVYVPRQTDLDLRATNGGLRVENVRGRIELETSNGGINLAGVSGDVRGRTSNGGVSVRLEGTRWDGAGLDLRTSNGGVTLHVPDGYSAQLETGTVNGRINTELPITVQGDIRRDLSTQLGQGGAPIRVRTTNGSVRIRRS